MAFCDHSKQRHFLTTSLHRDASSTDASPDAKSHSASIFHKNLLRELAPVVRQSTCVSLLALVSPLKYLGSRRVKICMSGAQGYPMAKAIYDGALDLHFQGRRSFTGEAWVQPLE